MEDISRGISRYANFAARTGAIAVGKLKAKVRPNPRDIKRMEIVFCGVDLRSGRLPPWPNLLNHKPRMRTALLRYARWIHRDLSQKHECFLRGINYKTYCSQRDRAADIIARRLNQAGLESW